MRIAQIIPGAILATLTLLGCTQSPDAKEAGFLEKGKKEFHKKNYAAAIVYFRNASAAKPGDAEPYFQLGSSYLAENNFNAAASAFRNAADSDPKRSDAQLKLAELLATSRDPETLKSAQRHAQVVLQLLPDDPDALNVIAVADQRLGNPESAQSHLEQALRKSPGHLKSWLALAQLKLAHGDAAGAEKALLQASAQLPKSTDLKIYMGQFYLSQGKVLEAEQQFRQALAIDPQQGDALLILASLEAKAGKTDQAAQIYRQAVAEFEKRAAADPADRNSRTKLVEAYVITNRVADAEKVLTAAVKKNGFDVDALMQRGSLFLESGRYAEAQADLKQVLEVHRDSAPAHYLLAKVARHLANPTIQRRELEDALRLDPSLLAARLDLAGLLLATRDARAALELIDDAPQDQTGAVPFLLERNWALLALGKKEDAGWGIERVLKIGKVPEALLQDAAMKLGQKDYAGARKSLEETLGKAPEDVRALFMLVESYAARNQTAEALQVMREYAQKQPESAGVQQLLGQILSANGDRAGARRAFETAKAARPGSVEADFALAQLDAAEGKIDEARGRLSEVVSSHPNNEDAHLLLAQAEMAAGNNSGAIDQFRKVVTLDNKDAIAFNALAFLLAESKQPEEAMKYAQRALELAPDAAAVHDTMGWIYYQQGLYTLAVVQLENANARQGTAVRKYHLAMAYLKAGKSERGRQTLDAALKMNPNLPEAQTARRAFGIGSSN